MIISAAELSDFDIDESPSREPMGRRGKAIMPTRTGGRIHRHRAQSRSFGKGIRGVNFPGAHQRRQKKVK